MKKSRFLRLLPLGAGVLVITSLVVISALWWGSANSSATGESQLGLSTTPVIRTTLIDTKTETGTLGFGEPVEVSFVSRSGTGIITWIAPEGSTVERGEPLFAIDGRPVMLFYGELPFYRTLRFDGASFNDFEWFELNTAEDNQREAKLRLILQRSRLAEAEIRLSDANTGLTDSQRKRPQTPQFIQLTRAVESARNNLDRTMQLAKSGVTSTIDVEAKEYELVVAQANIDAATRDFHQQVASAKTAVAEANLAVLGAERAARDARDDLDALLSIANQNADIKLLHRNLSALGYSGSASNIVRSWQADTGRSATGLIEPGQIVVATGPIRVAEHMVDIGDIVSSGLDGQGRSSLNANTSDIVLRYTTTKKLITVPLDIADHSYANAGNEVIVTLPNHNRTTGIISEVGAILDDQGAADVIVSIPEQESLGVLEVALVDVEFKIKERTDVLAVPISALLALPQSGYGVEIVEGGSTRITSIDTGMFAGGKVEISGADIVEGVMVGVP